MDQFGWSIVCGIISGLIATVIIELYHYLRRHFQQRKIRHLIWKKCPPTYNICIIYPVFELENGDNQRLIEMASHQQGSAKRTIVHSCIAESEMLAYRFIVNLLNSAKIEHKLESSSESKSNYLQGDILSLGLSNSESKQTLKTNRLVSVKDKGWIIKGREESITPSVENSYGMILRTTINEKTRLLCGGFNHFGTVGAARVFAEQHKTIIRILNKRYLKFDPLAFFPRPDFLVIVKGQNNYSNNFCIVEIWTTGWWNEPVMLYRDEEPTETTTTTVTAAETTTTTM